MDRNHQENIEIKKKNIHIHTHLISVFEVQGALAARRPSDWSNPGA
jgi:hypothetical protein